MIGSRCLKGVLTYLHLERLWRDEGPQDAPITLDRHRIFILPTREGLVFAGILPAMLIGATNYNNSMGFLLTFLLAGVGLVSLLHTYRNMSQLTLRAGHCAPVFAGHDACYIVFIDNPAAIQRCALSLKLDDGSPTYVDLPPQRTIQLSVTRPATQRGYLPMGRCTVSSRFPVGLFRAWAYIDLGMQCVVYPTPAPPHALPPLRTNDHHTGSDTYGHGVEDFVGLRQYTAGDSPRHIAWKRVAHGGELLTKQFAGEGNRQRWLRWEDVPQGETEMRLAVLCRWVLNADAAGLPYGLCLPGCDVPPSATPAHRHACLKALALYGVA
jgi:uncharacterized protein (DUF58 family)